MVSEPLTEPDDATSTDVMTVSELGRAVPELPAPPSSVRTALATTGAGYGRLSELATWWVSASQGRLGHDDAQVLDREPDAVRARFVLDAASEDAAGLGSANEPWPDTGPPLGSDPGQGWAWGVSTADRLIDEGAELIVVCVDAPIAASLVAAELMGLDPIDALGWPVSDNGIDIDDDAWMDAVISLRDGLRRTRGLRSDPAALLRAAGDARFAAAAAVIMRTTARATPVLLDGTDAVAAALCMQSESLAANQWWQVAQVAPGRQGERSCESLRREPLLDLGLRVQNGTGARAALALLAEATRLVAQARRTR